MERSGWTEEDQRWANQRGEALTWLESNCPPWCEVEGRDHLDISPEGDETDGDPGEMIDPFGGAAVEHRRRFSPNVSVVQEHWYGRAPGAVQVQVQDSCEGERLDELSVGAAGRLLEKLRSAYVFAAGVEAKEPCVGGAGGFVGLTDEHVRVALEALASAKGLSFLEALRWVAAQPTDLVET